MSGKLAIIGAGGFGREVLQLVRDINATAQTWDCLGFIVDGATATAPTVAGLPVLGDFAWLEAHPEVAVVVAVGAPAARARLAQRVPGGSGARFATLVHPRAWIGANVALGEGTVICAGALVTTDIRIGSHVLVNIGCTVGHDAVLDDFATLNPSVNISGNVRVAEGAEIGTGSVVIPKCGVGAWSVIGAGAVVTGDLPANCTAVGAPARAIKQRPEGWQLA